MEHVIPTPGGPTVMPDDDQLDEIRDKPPVPLKDIRPEIAALGVNTFDDLPLHPSILAAISKLGWSTPTPVQKLCLPFSLRGRDVAGFAQTGTGKTGVFLITILNKLLSAEASATRAAASTGGDLAPASADAAADTAAPEDSASTLTVEPGATAESGEPTQRTRGRVPRAIVIAPTRELAIQGEQDAADLFAQTGIRSLAVFGGIDYEKQARDIREGVDVIFATPGRLKDYIQKKVVRLEDITVFVCDEADRMFDMGFIEDVEFFLERIPESAQRLLFSATTNDQVKELAFEYLENPEYISVNPEVITPERIEQHALHCHATDKLKVLLGLLAEHQPDCAIIFTNTKLTAEWLHFKLLHNGIEADLISGDLPQKKRISLIHKIKEGKIKALVATDVASRGLHISRITHVYNFDLPDEAANYVHRIGRTARAGAKGFAYSLVCDDYGQNLAPINELLGPIALRTEWPDEKFLTIVDKAGNPFEERYAARRERMAGGGRFGAERSGGFGGGGNSSGPGAYRGGSGGAARDGGRDSGPRRSGPTSGGGGRGGPERQQGSQNAGPQGQRFGQQERGGQDKSRGPGSPQGQQAGGQQGQGQQRRPEGGEGKRPRGRGGRGGQPQHEQQAGGGQQQQQQQQRQAGGQPGRGGPQRHQAPGKDAQPQQAAVNQPAKVEAASEVAPKSMGGMIKKLVKTIFGLGK